MDRDNLAQTVTGIVAEAEKEGFSYPLHVTIELADGQQMIDVFYADGTAKPIRAVTPMAGSSLLLPATVEVHEWDTATGERREERTFRVEIETAYFRRVE